jgi:hypothetical protein
MIAMIATAARVTQVPGPNNLVFLSQPQFGEPHVPLFFLKIEMRGTSLISQDRTRDALGRW